MSTTFVVSSSTEVNNIFPVIINYGIIPVD